MSEAVPASVPKSTGTGPIEEVVDEVENVVEHVFTPRPGGMIDNWHKEKARREAAQREAENAAEKIEEGAAYAVKVAELSPELARTNQIPIAAGGNAMILPMSNFRYRALIKTSANITISENPGKALSGIGYPLAATDPPLEIRSKNQLWAGATGAAVVSVLVEIYQAE